ncbi:hypothetical protein [Sorangium sp. So ce233]|uniref:hypothetical protein n=1 Tax=Sorangium sp. So ce233 TaxID=3133290 RepID=UPI003F64343B
MAAHGGRALFVVEASEGAFVIRTKRGGGADIVTWWRPTAPDLPRAEVAFSEDPDGPIAWLSGTFLYRWSAE